SSSSFIVPCTVGAAAACPNRCATSSRKCQSLREYGCALQVTSSVAASMYRSSWMRRSSDMSVQSDGSEATISSNVSASGMIRREGYMSGAPFPVDPQDPLAAARGQSLEGLLALLERLDGTQEAAVVPSAPPARGPPGRG